MAYGALTSGLIGAGVAAGEDSKQRMELANKEASQKRLLDMELEAKLDFDQRVDEFRFQKAGERLPETIRREGLINQGKIDAEKARLNDPDILKGLAAEANAKRDPQESSLRRLQIEKASLELNRAKEEAKLPVAESKQFDSLGKRASAYESAILKAQAEGNFDANSESGKKMLSDYQSILQQQQDVLTPYLKQPAKQKSGGASLLDEKFPVRQPAQDSVKANSIAQSESNGNTLSGVDAEINRLEKQLKTGEGVGKPLNPIQGSMPWITTEKDIKKRLNELYQRRALGK